MTGFGLTELPTMTFRTKDLAGDIFLQLKMTMVLLGKLRIIPCSHELPHAASQWSLLT